MFQKFQNPKKKDTAAIVFDGKMLLEIDLKALEDYTKTGYLRNNQLVTHPTTDDCLDFLKTITSYRLGITEKTAIEQHKSLPPFRDLLDRVAIMIDRRLPPQENP